jgi:hypothetical protein
VSAGLPRVAEIHEIGVSNDMRHNALLLDGVEEGAESEVSKMDLITREQSTVHKIWYS